MAIEMELGRLFGERVVGEALFCEVDGGNRPCLLLSPPRISYEVSVYIGDLVALVIY